MVLVRLIFRKRKFTVMAESKEFYKNVISKIFVRTAVYCNKILLLANFGLWLIEVLLRFAYFQERYEKLPTCNVDNHVRDSLHSFYSFHAAELFSMMTWRVSSFFISFY